MADDILSLARKWATDPYFDGDTRTEVQGLMDTANMKELADRFYRNLEFGTGGLRGVMGAGTNRVNLYTVRMATQGLANYISNISGAAERGVVIAHDSRINSPAFARETACVLAANKIKAYLFDALRPVPQLSFTVRHKKAIAGVCITASHNPPEYNGYKVYFEDGAQITPPHDRNIIAEVERLSSPAQVKLGSFEDGFDRGLIEMFGPEADEAYLEAVLAQSVRKPADNVKIVYTPLHGSGLVPVRGILGRMGFKQLSIVREQEEPDGRFPTVKSPNPEEAASLSLGLDYFERHKADLLLATDPDCDRVGIAVAAPDGKPLLLNGNQVGALLIDYVLTALFEQKRLTSGKSTVLKSIVTSDLHAEICKAFGVDCVEVLTGFKYVGEWIRKHPEKDFVFATEESYGYLRGTYARDKDGVLACMLISEMASHYKASGTSIYARLQHLYGRYGSYLEGLVSKTMKGKEGLEKISALMRSLREDFRSPFSDLCLKEVRDYKKGLDGLPPSDVLAFVFSDGTKISVRPSGTEPKLKVYFSVKGGTYAEAEQKLAHVREAFLVLLG